MPLFDFLTETIKFLFLRIALEDGPQFVVYINSEVSYSCFLL